MIVNHSTNECSLPDCFCHEAQRLESRSSSSSNVATTFEHEWLLAPSGRKRQVEQEDALWWYTAGARAREAELLEVFNEDLKKILRITRLRIPALITTGDNYAPNRSLRMAEKTTNEVILDMKNEVKWFRNAARKHALNASTTVIASTRIAEILEQEVHMRIGDKLAEWAERFEKAGES